MNHGYETRVWRARFDGEQERLREELVAKFPWERVFVQGFIEGQLASYMDATPLYKPPSNDMGMNPAAGE